MLELYDKKKKEKKSIVCVRWQNSLKYYTIYDYLFLYYFSKISFYMLFFLIDLVLLFRNIKYIIFKSYNESSWHAHDDEGVIGFKYSNTFQ